MAKLLKKAKATEPAVKSVAATADVKEDKDLFDPLPSTSSSSSVVPAYPAKRYIILAGESTKRRVFTHTLHKGTNREVKINFVNIWQNGFSVTVTNPSIKQLQELQSTYTRDRGCNVMKFSRGNTTSYTLYKMRVLSDAELETVFEED